jgi:hypothetical protein
LLAVRIVLFGPAGTGGVPGWKLMGIGEKLLGPFLRIVAANVPGVAVYL